MLGLPGATWVRLFIWMGIGVVVYAVYGYRRSRLRLAAESYRNQMETID
jgi:APA family basic amino acid/polyamine antiporter